jgi:transposase
VISRIAWVSDSLCLFQLAEAMMSVAVPIIRLEHSPAALRQAAARCGDAAQARRALAIALVLEGVSRQDAARQTGMDRQTLRDWVHRYNTVGLPGLRARKPDGRPPRLTAAQMTELQALVVAGPDPEQHKVIRWRCVDLRAEVARRFCVTVNEDTIGKWLKKLGLVRLQPRPFHPKKDAAEQEAFKKTSSPA